MALSEQEYKKLSKILILGDTEVGKSSIAKAVARKPFNPDYEHDLTIDIQIPLLPVSDQNITVQAWIMPGDQRFIEDTARFYIGADAAILVFDLTRPTTLTWLENCLSTLRAQVPGIKVILVGSKADLHAENNVPPADIVAFMVRNGIDDKHYKAVSAKINHNIDNIFTLAVTNYQTINHNDDPQLREVLTQRLQNYINRVTTPKQRNGAIDYAHNFWIFFKQSRAVNREINCELAKELVADLNNDLPKNLVFGNIEHKRNGIISTRGFNFRAHYAPRGLRSTEVRDIVRDAINGTSTTAKTPLMT